VYLRELKLRKDFKHLQSLKAGSQKSRVLIENMVPMPSHAKHLLNGELVFDELHDVTLLYSDLRGFTPLSAKMTPQALCKLLNLIYSAFDRHLEHFGLYKIGNYS
jgi:class 3 adenylate cyclase